MPHFRRALIVVLGVYWNETKTLKSVLHVWWYAGTLFCHII